jgi:TonB-linked SusC/RagA family outer membrane protein
MAIRHSIDRLKTIIMKKFIIPIILLFAFTSFVLAQEKSVTIHVIDELNNPIPEATITIAGNNIESFITDKNGNALLPISEGTEINVVKFNQTKRTLKVHGTNMNVCLSPNYRILDIGYDQKITKNLSAGAIDGLLSSEMQKNDRFNIFNSLYGLLPGLDVKQGGTSPWNPYCNVTVRGIGSFAGNNVLVLVDGVERDASNIDVNEIESVTILKDAAALALYGNRGADGVICFTTKRGGDHKLRTWVEYNSSIQQAFRIPSMTNAANYAKALNEARENDGLEDKYTQADILSMVKGEKTDILPNINWKNQLLRKTGFNNEVGLTIDGASNRTRYFVYTSFTGNRGLFKNTDFNSDYSTQVEMYSLKARTNLEMEITPKTHVRLNMYGRLFQYQDPLSGIGLDDMYNVPAAAFPLQKNGIWVQSQMFTNPLANKTSKGYNTFLERTLLGDITIDQDLSGITSGLSAQVRISYDNSANIIDSKSKDYTYYLYSPTYDDNGNMSTGTFTNYNYDSELDFSSRLTSQVMRTSVWGKVSYTRDFGLHHIDLAGIYQQNYTKLTGANNSYMYRDYIGDFSYNYANKYIVNAVMSYAGSGKLAKGDKYRFYPAISAAWVISNEDFFSTIKNIDYLKLRASFGVTGMDRNLSYDMDKQFNGGSGSYIFVGTSTLNGLGEGTLPTTKINPEKEYKSNIGVEFGMFKGLTMELDGFYNRRKHIRVSSMSTISSVLGISVNNLCRGDVKNYGGEFSVNWRSKIKDFTYSLGANIAYAKNKIMNSEEGYKPYDYMKAEGQPIGRYYGLTADGFYQQTDFDNDGNLKSGIPVSAFIDKVQAGDVKYKDMNNDGKINEYDYSYQLNPSTPEIFYGFNLKAEYKDFGIACYFQGIAKATTSTTLSSIYWPLYGNDKNISNHYYNDHWTVYTPNAKYPRLTTLTNANNFRGSTLWTEKADYLKLRNLELYYSIPKNVIAKLRMSECKVIFRGTNLFSIDHVDIMDPEFISMGYPSLRSYSIGFNVLF